MLKAVFTTGGTGGHIFPALACAAALKSRFPDASLLFIGATYGPERKMALERGIPFVGLPGRGMLGRGLRAVPAAFDNLAALFAAICHLRKFSPCVVAAFGGYASFPAACAARLLGIPLLLHEQNAVAGTVNSLLSRFASRVCVSLPDTRGLKGPFAVTGNPVRKELDRPSGKTGCTRHLLVLGGSQGAHALNVHMAEIAPELRKAGVEILHQSGERDFAFVRDAFMRAGYAPECVKPFIDDMAEAYGWADLAFCRAGASTVAELCVAGVPAILVPFPAAIHDHQTLNAKALEKAGAAEIIREGDISQALAGIISLFDNPRRLAAMSRGALSLRRPEAADLVAAEIAGLCNRPDSGPERK